MRMQAAQAPESLDANSGALEVRQHDAARVSNDDVFYVAAPIDEDADLPAYFTRNLGEMSSKFLGDDLAGMNAPLIELLQAVDLAWFKTLQVPFDIYDRLSSQLYSIDSTNILHQNTDCRTSPHLPGAVAPLCLFARMVCGRLRFCSVRFLDYFYVTE